MKIFHLGMRTISIGAVLAFLAIGYDVTPSSAETSQNLVPGKWGSLVAIGKESDPGYDAKAIARWNVVPYQTVDRPFQIGVVAFHINGIDRVEFQVDGGPVVSVNQRRMNPRTKTFEYWVQLDPKDFSKAKKEDGVIEVRAIAIPKRAGIPRDLDRLILNMNSSGKSRRPSAWISGTGDDKTGDGSKERPFRQPDKAFRTISRKFGNADGAIVYALPGEYVFGLTKKGRPPRTKTQWATITAAPNVTRNKVIFTSFSKGGFKTNLIHVQNVTFKSFLGTAKGGQRRLWMDNSEFVGRGRETKSNPYLAQHWTAVYVTDSKFSDFRNASQGAAIVRNVKAFNIGSDAFGDSRLVVNSEVHNITSAGTKNHPDVFQFSGRGLKDNYIVYGLVATDAAAQGIFADDAKRIDNVAFVNVLIVKPLNQNPDKPLFSQWITPTNHLVMSGISLPNSTFLWRSDKLKNISVKNSVFYKVGSAKKKGQGKPVLKGEWFDQVHLISSQSFNARRSGSNITVGDAKFENPAAGNFTPAPNSPLRGRLKSQFDPVDAKGNLRKTSDAIGALR